MDTSLHIFFALGRLIYSFVGRRDRLFILYEFSGTLFIVIIAISFGDKIYSLVKCLYGKLIITGLPNEYLINMLYASIWGFALMISAILSRLLKKKNPIEISQDTSDKTVVVAIGIIDFSWLTMISLTYALILFCKRFPIICTPIDTGMLNEAYHMYFEEISILFNRIIDMILILGTILAACGTILWGGELWRKRDPKSRKDYRGTTAASIQMICAYLTISISTIIWIELPLYIKLNQLKQLIK